MNKTEKTLIKTDPSPDSLFERVVAILERARANVVRAVNSNMVVAYWLIGQEIVQELQRGEERAEYGRHLINDLSTRLTEKYGKGFSTTNLWYFRQFYNSFKDRSPNILHPMGGESENSQKLHPTGGESPASFHPNLSWSHYRALMRVENEKA
ncbi:MAG: DUF1016 N-terminal domain-containing protein, partial [Pseudomonadota bacterium]